MGQFVRLYKMLLVLLGVALGSGECCDRRASNWLFKRQSNPGYPDWRDMKPNYAHIKHGQKWNKSEEKTLTIRLLDYGDFCGDENATAWWHWLFLTNRTLIKDDLTICDPRRQLFCNASDQCDCMYQVWSPMGFFKTLDSYEPHYLRWDPMEKKCATAENSGCNFPRKCGRGLKCKRTLVSARCVCDNEDDCPLRQAGEFVISKAGLGHFQGVKGPFWSGAIYFVVKRVFSEF